MENNRYAPKQNATLRWAGVTGLWLGCAVRPEIFCLGEEGGRVYYWDRVAVVVAEAGEGLDLEKRVEPAATYAEGDEVDF